MRIYYLEGRPEPGGPVNAWGDGANGLAIFASRERAKLEIPKMIAAGWSEIRVYSDQVMVNRGDSRILEVSTITLPDVEKYQPDPSEHPLAKGIQAPTEPKDATLQRLEEARMLAKMELHPEACYLSPSEQAKARRLLEW